MFDAEINVTQPLCVVVTFSFICCFIYVLSKCVCVCVCLQCHPAESLRLFVPHCCGAIFQITDSQYHTVCVE